MRDPKERLRHILEAIENVERYVPRGRAAYDDDELIQSWMVRHLQVIGEAVNRLPEGMLSQHPEVPWSSIIGMRNVLVHDYFLIDHDVVWQVVDSDLPDLKPKIESILRQLEAGDKSP